MKLLDFKKTSNTRRAATESYASRQEQALMSERELDIILFWVTTGVMLFLAGVFALGFYAGKHWG